MKSFKLQILIIVFLILTATFFSVLIAPGRYVWLYKIGYRILYRNDSDTFIKKIIALDYPNIDDRNVSDFERVSILRRWVAKNIDWGDPSTKIEYSMYYSMNLKEIYDFFQNDLGSVQCGGSSEILMMLYELYGYKTYGYDSGGNASPSHVITLVEIEYKGRKILSIQDSSYNLTYVHRQGDPYDFFDFLIDVKKKNMGDIYVSYDDEGHEFICKDAMACPSYAKSDLIYQYAGVSKIIHHNSRESIYNFIQKETYLHYKDIYTFDKGHVEPQHSMIKSIIH